MENLNIEMPDTQPFLAQSMELAKKTESFKVITHDDYLFVGEHLKSIKGVQKRVVELFREPKLQTNKAHKAICEAEKKLLDPLKRIESVCNQEASTYLIALRQKEEEEATRRRSEAEAQARKQAEEEQLRRAEAVATAGDKEAAMKILEETPVIAPIEIAPIQKAERVEDQHVRTTYRAEVTDFSALVKAVAAGQVALSVLEANLPVLNKMAVALKEELRIPGVKVVAETKVVTRT